MRRAKCVVLLAALLLSASMFIGCAPPGAKLYGKWEADLNQSIDEAEGDDSQKAMLKGFLALSGAKITMEFKPDGTAVFVGNTAMGNQTGEGKWKVLESSGDHMIVEAGDNNGSRKYDLTFSDPQTFRMKPPDGQIKSVIFRKAAPAQ